MLLLRRAPLPRPASLAAALAHKPALAALQEPVTVRCKLPRRNGLANLPKEAQVVVGVVHLQQHLRGMMEHDTT